MKLKLTTKAPSDALASNAPAAPPAQDEASAPAPKIKFKVGKSALSAGADGQDGDATKPKRKYTKKATVEAAPKKRAREDDEDGDTPSGKRKSRPTAKVLAEYGSDDDDEPLAQQAPPPLPRPAPIRTQS